MSELHDVQRKLMAWLIDKDRDIDSEIVETKGVSTERRLSIYGNAYGYRLIDALSENYPAVHTLLGDDDFFEMTYAYIDAHPSRHFSLRYFGHKLEGFLKEYKKDLPVVADMARFEWALRNAFDSEDLSAIDMGALQEVPIDRWGSLQFKFHPSVSRLNLEWNTPQLWSAIDEEADPIAPEKLEYPYSWVVWRKELINYYRSLDVDEAWSLDAALQGESFGYLCEGICEWIDAENAPARVAGFLSQWIEDALLIDIQVT